MGSRNPPWEEMDLLLSHLGTPGRGFCAECQEGVHWLQAKKRLHGGPSSWPCSPAEGPQVPWLD